MNIFQKLELDIDPAAVSVSMADERPARPGVILLGTVRVRDGSVAAF